MNSVSSTGRASLGFMRSSFVLKKEIETQGYNHPENVVMPGLMSVPVSPSLNKKSSNDSLRPSRNSIYLNNKANSVSSFAGLRNKYSGYAIDNNSPEDSSYDLLNSFSQSPPPVPLKDNLRTSHYKYHDEQPKKKSGLLGRISSIFLLQNLLLLHHLLNPHQLNQERTQLLLVQLKMHLLVLVICQTQMVVK